MVPDLWQRGPSPADADLVKEKKGGLVTRAEEAKKADRVDDEQALFRSAYTLLLCSVREEYSEQAVDLARKVGAGGATMLLGKGVLLYHRAKMLGLPLDLGREIILLAVPSAKVRAVMEAIYQELNIKTEARGLVAELPLVAAAGITAVALP